MRKLKLLFVALALLVGGGSSAWAGTDVTASYIGDVTWIVNGGGHSHSADNHNESDGIGWWNNQTLPTGGWHAFAAPNANGGAGESWTPGFGNAGVMMGRTMVLPSGNYTLSFEAFATNASNSSDPSVAPTAGDAVAFLTGEDNIDITNTTVGGNTFHNVSFTFDVTTANSAYEFGIKKLTDESKIDWCQIKNVTLTLNSTDVIPVANNNVSGFTYSGSQTWHTNTWSTEGQRDGSRFQVPFHELWVASGGKLDDATIKGSYTPTQTGVYKVSAWVRAVNESGGAVSGVKIFVGDAESDACAGSPVISGKGRLGTYTAMADGVSGTPFEYGFKLEGAEVNWLAFKNVTITYLGSLPNEESTAIIASAEALEDKEMDVAVKNTLTTAKTTFDGNRTVANYNALAAAIASAQASIDAYTLFAPERTKALALGMTSEAIAALAPDVQALMVAEYNFVTTNYSYGVSLGTWTTVNAGEMSGQHWDGSTGDGASSYSEQKEGWGSGNWTCSYSQDLTLPAGNYVFKVAGRRSVDATLTLTVKKGEDILGIVNDFPIGDAGKGIDTSGAANFGDGTYANSNNGRGWQWRYVKFTLTDPSIVNIAVVGAATLKYNWVGFCNATVQTDDADNVALMEALVALNSAKAEATLVKNTTNIGTGVFQFNETTNDNLWSAYTTAKGNADDYAFTSSSTASEVNGIASALRTAIANYSNQPLNAPAVDKRYYLNIVQDGKAWNGNAITFVDGARTDMGLYGIKYLAPSNANLNQALKFTAVDGESNTYKVSAINVETGGEQYITTGAIYDKGNNTQIRTTDDASKASWVKIGATATEGQFQLLNVSDGNKVIANNNNNDMYTAGTANFTISEAVQASVDLTIDAAVKYATRIFPFTPALPSGVKTYSCEAAAENTLTLAEVATPAANTPYILFAEEGNTGSLNGWGVAGATSYTVGWLTGTYVDMAAPNESYILQNHDGKVGFYQVDVNEATPQVRANRAYMTVPDATARAFFFADGEATAVKALNTLMSGKAEIFNLKGERIGKLQKGMNIIKTEGKIQKVMVK